MNNAKQVIEKLKYGNKDETKLARKAIDKAWWKDRTIATRKNYLKLLLDTARNLDKIEDNSNKRAIVLAFKYLYINASEDELLFKECKDLILRYIQDKNGNIRQAVVQSADYIAFSLVLDNDHTLNKTVNALKVKKHRNLFGELIDSIYVLLHQYSQPQFDKCELISDLPVGIYKSLELLLRELLQSEYYEKVYEEYRELQKVAKNPNMVYPKIKLKYLRRNKEPLYKDYVCDRCKKVGINIGSAKNVYTDSPIYYCENCAIDLYKKEHGFSTRRAAESRRRRMFDVGYLFCEMITDRYLLINELRSIDNVSSNEIEYLSCLGKDAYNNLFTKSEKIEMEGIKEQKEIRKALSKKLDFIDRSSFDRI